MAQGRSIIPSAHARKQGRGVDSKGKTMKPQKKDTRRHRLSRQILLYFLAISLIPLFIVSGINFMTAREILLQTEADYLGTIGERQVKEIRSFLEEIYDFVELVAQSPGAILTLQSLSDIGPDQLATLESSDAYKEIDRNVGPVLRGIVQKFGFNQLYLINPDGVIVFSEPSLGYEFRNLKNEPEGPTQLGKLFHRTSALMSSQASDFRVFAPLDRPSLFISAPVLHEGLYLGAIVMAIDNNKINEKLADLTGLGDTAEIVFASQEGDRIMVLNDLRRRPGSAFNHTEPYNPPAGQQLTPMQRAVRGESGGGLATSYSGEDVLALWDYLPNLRIGIIIKIDKSEVFSPVHDLLKINVGVALVTIIIVALVAILLSRGITKPINLLTESANRLADGDLRHEIPSQGRNEVGQLALATRTMAHNLKSLVGKVKVAGSEITKTSQVISGSAQQQVSSAQQTGTSAVEVNTTAKEIASTARELADTMKEVNEVTQQTALKAESGLDVLTTIQNSMSELENANGSVSTQLELIQTRAEGISGIITTMTKVADQTNLLSLNAAIEARKAGEYGRGFSVVATEIRRLADQAAASTLEIERSVKDMLGAVHTGVNEMKGFSKQVTSSVGEIKTISSRLTEVIQQVQGLPPRFDMILEGMTSQAEGAGQINEAMGQLSDSAQQTASAVRETHRMLDSLKRSAEILEGEISRFKT